MDASDNWEGRIGKYGEYINYTIFFSLLFFNFLCILPDRFPATIFCRIIPMHIALYSTMVFIDVYTVDDFSITGNLKFSPRCEDY